MLYFSLERIYYKYSVNQLGARDAKVKFCHGTGAKNPCYDSQLKRKASIRDTKQPLDIL